MANERARSGPSAMSAAEKTLQNSAASLRAITAQLEAANAQTLVAEAANAIAIDILEELKELNATLLLIAQNTESPGAP